MVRVLGSLIAGTDYEAATISGATITGVTGRFAGTVFAQRGEFSQGLTVSGIPVSTADGGGVTDHGSLTGLADDDHPQYLRTDGTRTYTGSQNFGGFNATNIGTAQATTVTGTTGQFGGTVSAQNLTASQNVIASQSITAAQNVTGNVVLANTVFRSADTGAGSATSPAYSFSIDSDTGMYRTGLTDVLHFSAGGVQRVTISGANATTSGLGVAGNITSTNAITAVTGTFTQGLTVGTSTTHLNNAGIVAPTGTFTTVTGVTGQFGGTVSAQRGEFSTGLTVSGKPVPLIFAHGDLTGLGFDHHSQYLRTDGTRTMTGDLALGTNDIAGVTDITFELIGAGISMPGSFSSITLGSFSSLTLGSLSSLTLGSTSSLTCPTITGTTGQFAGTISAQRGEFSTGLTVSGIPVLNNLVAPEQYTVVTPKKGMLAVSGTNFTGYNGTTWIILG